MDRSSRKVVKFVAIGAITIMAVIAGSYFADPQVPESTAATEPPPPLNDQAEAAISAGSQPSANSEFSSDVPMAQDIPAINGAPSMTFENDQANQSNPRVNKDDPGASEAGTAVIVQ